MKKSILLFLAVMLLTTSAICPTANADTVQPPAAPGTLAADITTSYIQVSTSDSTPAGQTTYIEKSVDAGDYSFLTTLSSGAYSYNDYSVTNGHVYKYRAKRYNNQASTTFSAYSNEAEAIWLYPVSLNITGTYSDQIDISWSYPQLTAARTVDYQTVVERRLETESSWTVVYTAPFSQQDYRDAGLKSDSLYFYRIRTKYPNGQYSNYFPTTTGISTRTIISLTTSLSGFALTDTQIRLDWDATVLNGATVILQKMNSTGDFVTIPTSIYTDHFTDTGLTPGKEYSYRLYMNSSHNTASDYSDTVDIMTETIPSPTQIKASAAALGRIVLSWTYPYDVESGFEVWRKEQGSSWQKVAGLPRNTAGWTDYGALTGKLYTYRVRATRGDNVFSDYITSSQVNNADPSSPPDLIIAPMGIYLMVGTDTAPPQGVTYALEYRADINADWKDYASTETGKPLIASFIISSGVEYDLRLRSQNQGNMVYGPIHHIYAKKPEAPTQLKTASIGSNNVLLYWTDNTRIEDGYHIYRTSGGVRTLIGTTAAGAASFADSGTVPGSSVKYEVCAFNAMGDSAAAIISVKIPKKAVFKDISGITWASDAINSLSSLGAISQNPDGLFYPNKTITKAEFITMLFKSFSIAPESGFLFSLKDVPSNAWYYPYIMTAVKYGIIIPGTDGRTGPGDPLSKANAAVILARLAAFRNQKLTPYETSVLCNIPDGYLVPDELQGIAASLAGDFIMPARYGEALNLDKTATRAEAAAIIYRFYRKYL